MEIHCDALQKRSALFAGLFFGAFGVVSLFLAFWPSTPNPSAYTVPDNSIPMPLVALAYFAMAWWLYRTHHAPFVRVDDQGLTYSNGFIRRRVLWREVAVYYLLFAPHSGEDRPPYSAPYLLDAQGHLLFDSFPPILVSTSKNREQTEPILRFIEAQLGGKQIPPPDAILKWKQSQGIRWERQTSSWKLKRSLTLALIIFIWGALVFGPFYYLSVDTQLPKWADILFFFPKGAPPLYLFLSTFWPVPLYVFWIKRKRRQLHKAILQP